MAFKLKTDAERKAAQDRVTAKRAGEMSAASAARRAKSGPSLLERMFNFKTEATRYKESKASRASADLSGPSVSKKKPLTASSYADVPAAKRKTPVASSSFADVPRSAKPKGAGKAKAAARSMAPYATRAASVLASAGLSEDNAVMKKLRSRGMDQAFRGKK